MQCLPVFRGQSIHRLFSYYARDKERLGCRLRLVPLFQVEEAREENAPAAAAVFFYYHVRAHFDHDYHAGTPEETDYSVKEESSDWNEDNKLSHDSAEIISVCQRGGN
ncbi:hypothetical protein COCON_G00186500 [Conger conger]|uniref:Uncharacterized protein n=1 Tax=Conger conger TaxID=82655 RepID=A0A9Q1D3G1_CONCO|nr:hypothetical protein COCON_G00186500 [Conger conger]